MRAAEVEFDAVGLGILDRFQDVLPIGFLTGDHQGNDQGAVFPLALDLFDFLKVHLKRAVGDKFDVVQAQKAAVCPPDRAIAGARDVDDGRAFGPERLPHDATPARLKCAFDVVFLVRGRRRGQPERVRGFDADEIGGKVSHGKPP
jgi:hypothetical protein